MAGGLAGRLAGGPTDCADCRAVRTSGEPWMHAAQELLSASGTVLEVSALGEIFQ